MKRFLRLLLSLFLAPLLFVSCHYLTAAGIGSQGLPTKKIGDTASNSAETSAKSIDHSDWTALLQKHVDNNGMVNYKGFLEDRKALNAYTSMLSSLEPSEKWPTNELLAYYINLYNAYTVDLILSNYPLNSIKDINGAFTKAIIPVGSTKLSLGGLENGVLRKMNEPRIHFAINCASISCPPLAQEAYTADGLDTQLTKATKRFINSDANTIYKNKASLSKIFKWYEKDFITEKTPNLSSYINQYSKTKIDQKSSIHFKAYDWSLNDQD